MRKVTSSAKVRGWVGSLLRNNPWQVRRALRSSKQYLDLGCGPNMHAHVINLDYLWRPGLDICWDLSKGIPLPDQCMKGVFSEHVLEHFSPAEGFRFVCEAFRVLRPGGVFRVIVPDAGMYLERYNASRSGSDVRFPFQELVSFEGSFVPMLSVNGIFYMDRDNPAGHRTMYDEELLSLVLEKAGFECVQRQAFGQGIDPELILDTPSRQVESLYIEARRPRS